MSTNRATGKAAQRPPVQEPNFEEWDEARLEVALQKLKEAHLKVTYPEYHGHHLRAIFG
jgi:hypothetical protein